MCLTSYIGDGYQRDYPDRWPQVPIQPFYPWVAPGTGTKAPSEIPHAFQPTQDALRECVVCGYPRSHGIHAAFEPIPEPPAEISKEDFDALKREVEELRELLLAAKHYDEATGQVDCEKEDRIDLIRRLAKYVDVDMDEVFGKRP